MEVFSPNNVPELKEGEVIIPLFTLDTLLLPEDQMMMRVFEPRYKQMLDDCILNELPFGYIAAKKPYSEIEGWSAPAEFGVLAQIENFTEQGSNLLFTAKGESRFKIKKIIPPALPAKMFEDVFPSVEELVEVYIDNDPNGKLYLRAEIELIDDLTGEIDEKRWEDFIISWSKYLIKAPFFGGLTLLDSRARYKASSKEGATHPTSPVEAISTPETGSAPFSLEKLKTAAFTPT